MLLIDQTKTIENFISRYQVDGVMWKADRLLRNLNNPILRNDRCKEIAAMLALIPESEQVMRDDYVKRICADHDLKVKTLDKMIEDSIVVQKKAVRKSQKKVRKNEVKALSGDPKTFRFFEEVIKQKDHDSEPVLEKIKVDKYRFVELLASFGFTRYETGDNEYTFVRLQGNVIAVVTREQIIDFLEVFVKRVYDFDGAKYVLTGPQQLIRAFYDQIRTIFSKDLFARVRTENPIVMSRDLKDTTFLYYQNGFVEITKDGWKLLPYEEMNGSVWDTQMLKRSFKVLEKTTAEGSVRAEDLEDFGVFADYCWKVANEDLERFKALCCIIGYLTHDFYATKLKAILFTDSSLSEHSEGRTGKTLLAKMVGEVRSYCEINGKDFDSGAITKYQQADIGTQVLHLNDVKHKGRFKFDFEDVFNDITEGYIVKKLYMPTFRQYSKMIISSNKTLNIQGGSQRDRIIEFEMSPFFGEHRSPADYYGHWFLRDWDEAELNRFDNFMCYCGQLFHIHGLHEPATINLGERKLMNHTSPEFLEFMDEVRDNLKARGIPWDGYADPLSSGFTKSVELTQFQFDRRKMYERFVFEYPDFKATWFTIRLFNKWVEQFSELRLGVKNPKTWKSNGLSYIQFIPQSN